MGSNRPGPFFGVDGCGCTQSNPRDLFLNPSVPRFVCSMVLPYLTFFLKLPSLFVSTRVRNANRQKNALGVDV